MKAENVFLRYNKTMMNELRQSLLNLINSERFAIEIRKAGKYSFSRNFVFGIHNHREFELNYVSMGSCVMEIEGTLTSLKEGDVVLISPNIAHCFMVGAQKSCCLTQLEFQLTLPEQLDERFSFLDGKRESIQISDCVSVENVMKNICRFYREDRPLEYEKLQMELCFAQLFVELSYALGRQGENENLQNRQSQLLKYINRNFEREMNIEQLSREFGISSRSVRKYFEEVLGISCSDYITMLRMEKSKELLWNTGKSITDISAAVGYGSSQYFSKVFHKYTGMTPSKFRNSWKGITAEEKLYE